MLSDKLPRYVWSAVFAPLALCALGIAQPCHAQNEPASRDTSSVHSGSCDEQGQDRYVLWFTPSCTRFINGVSIGPVLSGVFYGRDRQTVNGLAVGLPGFGTLRAILAPFLMVAQIRTFTDLEPPSIYADSLSNVNGLLLSALGSESRSVSGIGISGFAGNTRRAQGLYVNPFSSVVAKNLDGVTVGAYTYVGNGRGLALGLFNAGGNIHGAQLGLLNSSRQTQGLQIGLYNYSRNLIGLQIGLLNRTPERILPLLNWDFGE